MPKPAFDVCVVGSGPDGGIAAYVLAAAGLRTTLVEAGPRLQAGVDYGFHLSPREALERRLRCPSCPFPNLWGARERNHFTPAGDRPDHGWLKAGGGRSLCWAGHSLCFGLPLPRVHLHYEANYSFSLSSGAHSVS